MKRIRIAFFLMFVLVGNKSFSQNIIKNVSPNISYDKPGTFWVLFQDSKPESNNKGAIMYKHSPILDSSNSPVEPVFAIVYENIRDSIDAIEYSVNGIGSKP